jgi:hypothetical protein
MIAKTDFCQVNANLDFYSPPNFSFTVTIVKLTLIRENCEIAECCLVFRISLELYQDIEKRKLFNLRADERFSIDEINFQNSLPILFEIGLKPDLLPHLQKYAANASEAVEYLLRQKQILQPEKSVTSNLGDASNKIDALDPLLETKSWLALSVMQSQASGEVGYRTLWSYASLLGRSMLNFSKEDVSESVNELFHELGLGDLPFGSIAKEIAAESIGSIANLIRSLDEAEVKPSSQESHSNEVIETSIDIVRDAPQNQPLLEAVISFFKENHWQFVLVKEHSTLRLAFEGQHGRYDCYAQARETQQQLVFYSIYPIITPEDRRGVVAEFITRANYGMVLGNFELDYSDGEIRYKTSIDVEGDRLSSALIKQLVYINVSMMDEYLPGITAVLDGRSTPLEAIHSIEQASSVTQTEI